MASPLVFEGKLILQCQEGGFAADDFEIDGVSLDNLVADHFGIKRQPPMGNRPIGRVRISIEKLEDA